MENFTKNINSGKFIDLFAGIGGFRRALESFGLQCVYSSEWDKFAQQTYKANYGETPDGDITKVDEKDIPKHNILCGGFPCQAFSISGKQKGFEDTRGTLFFEVARIVAYHKPEILFLENVKNFAKHDDGRTLKTVDKTLTDLGYTVFHKILNASQYGAPTSRERIYFVCFRNDLGVTNFKFPKPISSNIKLEDFLEDDDKTNKYVIRRKDIQIYKGDIDKDIFGNYPQKPIQIGIINKGGQGERIYSPLGHTITLSAYGGGAASKTGGYLVNGVVRKLSPRECARVMGFGDDFVIPVADSQAYKQFGNSVVVNVLKCIFSEIQLTLTRKDESKMSKMQGVQRLSDGFSRRLTSSEIKRGYIFVSSDKSITSLLNGDFEFVVNSVSRGKTKFDKRGRLIGNMNLVREIGDKIVNFKVVGGILYCNF